ncbi:MAG: phosphopentomutase [Candidatus Ozemobacteraceae bacterium]
MRAICIVLDSVGIGAMPDAADYGDVGSATLPNLARASGGISLPTMQRLGIGNITPITGVATNAKAEGSWGRLHELSPGKDTSTGHWEMMGQKLEYAFPLFPKGFPQDFIKRFEKAVGRGTIANVPASGTEIIMKHGDEHVKTGKLIVYTSADSVFQIAAHEEVVPLADLYKYCQAARDLLQPPDLGVARVIARPFIGSSGAYKRTLHRHDFSLTPDETLLDVLTAKGVTVYGIGKIYDIFAGKGVNKHVTTEGNEDGMKKTMAALDEVKDGFIFVNLVDTDMTYGHRRDVPGYKGALEAIDRWLDGFLKKLTDQDLLIITADHGCDPTFRGTDHTREYPFVLSYQKGKPGRDLGIRRGFWDVAASVAAHLKIPFDKGTPFNS